MEDPREQARNFIKQAQRAAKRGDHAAAERWTRTAERFAQASEQIYAKFLQDTEEENDALVEDLMARLKRYAEADAENRAWDREKDVHDALLAQAQQYKLPLPPPLRPCPYGPPDFERIACEGLKRPR